MFLLLLQDFYLDFSLGWKKSVGPACVFIVGEKNDAEHQRLSVQKCRPKFIKEKHIGQIESEVKYSGETKTR